MDQKAQTLLTELKKQGVTTKTIAHKLNEKGFRKPRGGKYTDQDLFNFLWKEKQKAKRTAKTQTHQIQAKAPNQPPIDFIIRTLRSSDLTTEQKLKVVKDLL
jgi:hypothetical protein